MLYRYIVNPLTNRKVLINNSLGRKILNNYILNLNGGSLLGIKNQKDLKEKVIKHSNKLKKEVLSTSDDLKKDVSKKVKDLANREYWDNLDNQTKCEFCANLGETVCKNIYDDKIETIKNLIAESEQLNKMEQMHINNLNYERASKTRDQRIEIIRKATNLNNNLPSDKKINIPEIPVPSNN